MKMYPLTRLLRLLLLILAASSIAHAGGPPRVEQLEHQAVSANREQITLQLNDAYSPKVFTIQGGSPRLVLDFNGVGRSSQIKNILKVNGPLIKNIRVGETRGADARTRVVLDLNTLNNLTHTEHFDRSTHTWTICLTREDIAGKKESKPQTPPQMLNNIPATPKKAVPQSAVVNQPTVAEKVPATAEAPQQQDDISAKSATEQSAPQVQDIAELSAVALDDSSPDEERIEMQLNGFFPPTVHASETRSLQVLCDFEHAKIAPRLKKRQKLRGNYVQRVRILPNKRYKTVQVAIDLDPKNAYDLQQVFFEEENLFTLIVSPRKTDY